MGTPQHIIFLLRRYIAGTLTAAERREMLASMDTPSLEEEWTQAFADLSREGSSTRFVPDEWEPVIVRILQSPAANATPPPAQRIHFLKTAWFRYAAIFLLVAGTATFIYRGYQKPSGGIVKSNSLQQPTEIFPGSDKAILTLAGGEKIQLDSTANAYLMRKGITNRNSMLSYSQPSALTEMNTLTTPRGGQYKLQLSDGTNVWLNAASSITYPVGFTGRERKVTVSGEVYFEVAKNKLKPFLVAANNTTITVTGTHFNVNAHIDEPFLTTTLLEGGVKVSGNKQTVILSPNEQSLSDATGSISVKRNVNVSEIMAWREGFFHFESATLPTILRELARWYDVDVAYEGVISEERFFVIVNRKSGLSSVLKALQASDVEFNITGKRLTVKSKKQVFQPGFTPGR